MGNGASEEEARDRSEDEPKSTRPKKFKGPPTLMCHYCGQQFGTRGLPFHMKKCKEQFVRNQETIPKKHRKKLFPGPNMPTPRVADGPGAFERYNEEAYHLLRAGAMHACEGCGRSFIEYDKFRKHQKRCEDFRSGHRIRPPPGSVLAPHEQSQTTVHLWAEHASPQARVSADSTLAALRETLMQALGARDLVCLDINGSMASMPLSQFLATTSSDEGIAVSVVGGSPVPAHLHVLVIGQAKAAKDTPGVGASAKATPGVNASAKGVGKLSVKARKALGDVSEVLDGFLYLSGQLGATSKTVVRTFGITHILNLCSRIKCAFKKSKQVTYKVVDIFDTKSSDIRKHFASTNAFMRGAADAGGRVLVHCLVGASRSASICLAYLVGERGMSLQDAYRLVRTERVVAKPNLGFRAQLIDYEAEVRGGVATMSVEGFDKMAEDISEGRSTEGDYKSDQKPSSKRKKKSKRKARNTNTTKSSSSSSRQRNKARPASAGIKLHTPQRILVVGYSGCSNSELASRTCASYLALQRKTNAPACPLEVQTRTFDTENLYQQWLKAVPLRRLGIGSEGTAHSVHGSVSPFIWRSRTGMVAQREGAATYTAMGLAGDDADDLKDAPFTLGAYRYVGGVEALLAFLMSWQQQYKRAIAAHKSKTHPGGEGQKDAGAVPAACSVAKSSALQNPPSPARASVKNLLRLSRDSAAAQLLQKRQFHAAQRKKKQQQRQHQQQQQQHMQQQQRSAVEDSFREENDVEGSSVSEDVPVSDVETDDLDKSDVIEENINAGGSTT